MRIILLFKGDPWEWLLIIKIKEYLEFWNLEFFEKVFLVPSWGTMPLTINNWLI